MAAWVVLLIIGILYGVAGTDNLIKGYGPSSIMYYGLLVVNLALSWIEYHK